MNSLDYVNILCAITILATTLGGIIHRIVTKKGIGIRFCQFMAIGMGIPAFAILALAGKIEPQTIGSILGAIVGFFFSRTGKDEPNSS